MDNIKPINAEFDLQLNSDVFIATADKLITKLFQSAKVKDEAEFVPACLYFTGTLTYSDSFDTFKSFNSFYNQIHELISNADTPDELKVRLMMMLYCHTIETDALYNFIYNLTAIASGNSNTVEPFENKPPSKVEIIESLTKICSEKDENKKIKSFNVLTKKMIPVSIAQKIQVIERFLNKMDLNELGEILETLHNQKVRNAFAHNSYNVFGRSINLFTPTSFESISIEDFVSLFMKTVNFYVCFAEKATNVKKELADGQLHEYTGKYGDLSIHFIKEKNSNMGSFLVKSSKNSGSI